MATNTGLEHHGVNHWAAHDGLEVRTRLYRSGVLELEDFPLDDLARHMREPDCVVWADLCRASRVDLDKVAKDLQLHRLAVEDAEYVSQRPKLDRYATHAFLNLYAIKLDTRSGKLTTGELSAFLLPRALVTIRKDV